MVLSAQEDADEGDWLPAPPLPGSSPREPGGQAGTDAIVYADSNFVDERDRGANEQMEQSRAGLGEQRYSFLGRPRARVKTESSILACCCAPLQNSSLELSVQIYLVQQSAGTLRPACLL